MRSGWHEQGEHHVALRGPLLQGLEQLRRLRGAIGDNEYVRHNSSFPRLGKRVRLVRRQVRVPLAELAERLPEAALGALFVEGPVDVRHVERLAARSEPLDLPEHRLELAA